MFTSRLQIVVLYYRPEALDHRSDLFDLRIMYSNLILVRLDERIFLFKFKYLTIFTELSKEHEEFLRANMIFLVPPIFIGLSSVIAR